MTMEMPSFTEEYLTAVVTYVSAFLMIFGGIVPYIPQYLDIRRTKNADGFSLFVCLVLLIANIMRILFWFGVHFELPLLLQSIIMIITMFAMIHICTSVKAKSELVSLKPRIFSESESVVKDKDETLVARMTSRNVTSTKAPTQATGVDKCPAHFLDFDSRYFWRWTDFYSYVEFISLFAAMMGALTYFMLEIKIYIELIGFLAVFFEAMLGAPQFYRNYQNRSTKGMSVKMVLCWTSGDIFKTIYFVLRRAPIQFWICGTMQVCLDLAIIGQVFYYGLRKPAVL